MSLKTARNLFALSFAPLLVMAALRSTAEAEIGFVGAPEANAAPLNLATLKAEARALVVHIDGP
jgi:hypothetical protein